MSDQPEGDEVDLVQLRAEITVKVDNFLKAMHSILANNAAQMTNETSKDRKARLARETREARAAERTEKCTSFQMQRDPALWSAYQKGMEEAAKYHNENCGKCVHRYMVKIPAPPAATCIHQLTTPKPCMHLEDDIKHYHNTKTIKKEDKKNNTTAN